MKFVMKVNPATAAALITRIEDVAWSAGQQWDYVEFKLPDGSKFQYSHYGRSSKGRPERPAEFTSMFGVARSSSVEVAFNGEQWKVIFAGLRGSLIGHWGVAELLKADGGELVEYETSVPSMLPWEDLHSWFRRMTKARETEHLHPFDPVGGMGESEDFNRRFHAAIKELVRKRKLNGQQLKLYRDLIVADIKRKFDWTDAA